MFKELSNQRLLGTARAVSGAIRIGAILGCVRGLIQPSSCMLVSIWPHLYKEKHVYYVHTCDVCMDACMRAFGLVSILPESSKENG